MKLTNDIKLYVIAKIITIFSWVFIIKLFTNNLTATDYGNYSLTYTLIVLISAAGSVWITSSFVRFYPDAEQKNKLKLFNYLSVKATIPSIGVGLILLTLILSSLYFFNILQYDLIIYVLISLCFLGHISFLLYAGYLSAAREIKLYVLIVTLQITLYVGISAYLLANSELKLTAIFIALLISYTPLIFVVKNPINAIYNYTKIAQRLNVKGLNKYGRYGFPILFMSISIQVNSVADQYILKFYHLHDEVGMYAAFYTLSEKSLFVAYQVLSISALPIAFRYWEGGELVKCYKLFWKIIFLYAIMGLIGIAILLIFDVELTSLIINESYSAGIFIMPYILAGVFFGGFAALFSDVLLLKKKTLLLAKIYIFGAFINIFLNFILIPIYGMLGAAASTFISYTIIFLALTFQLIRSTDIFKVIFLNQNSKPER